MNEVNEKIFKSLVLENITVVTFCVANHQNGVAVLRSSFREIELGSANHCFVKQGSVRTYHQAPRIVLAQIIGHITILTPRRTRDEIVAILHHKKSFARIKLRSAEAFFPD